MESNDDKILGMRYTVYNGIWLVLFIAVCVLLLCNVLTYALCIIFFGALFLLALLSVLCSRKSPYKGWNNAAWAAALCSFLCLILAIFCRT
ncbi:MAG: hypothetical protein LIO79_11145 [Rikenellaceae bacterium]|nr:hypothetical protein [Rikenellaceae bacterium]MCC8112812.1 hypothetical protein [Bacteroidales bacterium]